MKNDRINKKVFQWDKEMSKENWGSSLKVILTDLDLEKIWQNNAIILLETAKSRWILESISLRVYNRFIKMKNDRINKKVFQWDKEMSKENWGSSLKVILTDLDLEKIWQNNAIIPKERAKSKIKCRMERDWEHHGATKYKLRTYRTLTTSGVLVWYRT